MVKKFTNPSEKRLVDNSLKLSAKITKQKQQLLT